MAESITINNCEYRIVEVLGGGVFSKVYKVRKNNDDKYYAIKEISIKEENEKNINDILREAQILSKFDCKYITKYYDSSRENKNFYILMEYCSGENLEIFLGKYKNSNKPLPQDLIYDIISQLCLGLKEIHDKNVVHRDIRPSNILINEDNKIKIADFGLSHQLNPSKNYTLTQNKGGACFYIAPEIFKDGKYNKKSDIYSLGCIIYELLTKSEYFQDKLCGEVKSIGSSYNFQWQKLIDNMLKVNINQRFDINQVYDFLEQINYDILSNKKIIIEAGNCSNFEVCLNDRIATIKDAFYPCYNRGVKIFYKNKVIDDRRIFLDYNIKDGDVLKFMYYRGCGNPVENLATIRIQYKDIIAMKKDVCLKCTKVQLFKWDILEGFGFSRHYKGICEIEHLGKILNKEDKTLESFGVKNDSLIIVHIDEDIYKLIKEYEIQLNQLYKMGFYEEEIDLKLLKQCMGSLEQYFKNQELDGKI